MKNFVTVSSPVLILCSEASSVSKSQGESAEPDMVLFSPGSKS